MMFKTSYQYLNIPKVLKLDYNTTQALCQTLPYRNICNDSFWKRKIISKYGTYALNLFTDFHNKDRFRMLELSLDADVDIYHPDIYDKIKDDEIYWVWRLSHNFKLDVDTAKRMIDDEFLIHNNAISYRNAYLHSIHGM